MRYRGPTTLVEALHESALSDRGIVIAGSGAADTCLPYKELLARAQRRLTALLEAGVAPGDEVIIVTDDLEIFLAAFWACVLGRIVPVPLAVPTTDEVALKILHVGQTLTRPWLYTDTDLTERLARAANVNTTAVLAALGERRIPASRDCSMPAAPPHPCRPDDIAFIQFSSGSTGTPKGVTLTHANLIANVSAIVGAIRADVPEPRLVNWMPLTHDFGMICFHVLPAVFGFDHCLIPTKAFTRNPLVWMQRCASFRASVTAGPNYSYRHFLRSFDPARNYGWDLSGLRVIINGAEPIAPELADEFTTALASQGLPPTAIRGAYGLAEATLVVTMGDKRGLRSLYLDRRSLAPGCRAVLEARDNPHAAGFAVVGRPLDGFEVGIADGAGAHYPDGTVGTVKLRGPSVTRGYYRNEAATRTTLDAQGWLDTGDLGFCRDGELIITGRRKDVIIIDGVNYYPQDIERIASAADGFDLNKVVACAVRPAGGEREQLAVFVLFRKKLEAFAPVARDISDRVTRAIGIPVDYCLAVPRIPKTTSGKIQRFELAQRFLAGGFAEQVATLERVSAPMDDAVRQAWFARDRTGLIAALTAAAAHLAPNPIDPAVPLRENGFTSLRLAAFGARLNRALGLELPVTTLFERPTLYDLADALIATEFPHSRTAAAPAADETRSAERLRDEFDVAPIAIVGLGLRLPGNVDGPASFWRLLEQGRDAVGAPPPGRWTRTAASEMATDHAGYLNDLTAFDAPFFRLSPAEAEALDPQQRLLLTVSWEALEHAGIDPGALKGTHTGVYVGISGSDYRATEAADGPYFYTGTAPSVAAGRLSYHYGLNGPCLAIDTACSSSLVALHQAALSLRSGESDLAIVGGVNLLLDPETQTGLSRMNALAHDGRCKTFDDTADGYGRGEGCVVLVAMRLERALADGFSVLALIRGSAVNHDGASNGLTAPNGAAQAAVMQAALAAGGVAPDTVDYLETHGTGTALGDPIEVAAAASVYSEGRDAARPLLLGSVKTAIGHLEAAAGLAGVAKVVLALRHRTLPPSLHFRTPNRHISWHSLPVQVVGASRPWPEQAEAGTRTAHRASVSSFGMSGTNAHVVLEAAAPSPTADAALRPVIVPLSARSDRALAATAARWAETFTARGDIAVTDLAFTAAVGRAKLSARAAIVSSSAAGAAAALRNLRPCPRSEIRSSGEPPRVVFAFAGHGSQTAGMGRVLFERFPVFRSAMLQAETILAGYFDRPFTELLFDAGNAAALARTEVTQPAVVAFQWALVLTLRDWGIRPAGVVGHSLGEIAAAAAAGAVDPAAALRFAAERGRLMQTRSGGAMAAVGTGLSALQADLTDLPELAVAAINGSAQLTLSGPAGAIESLLGRLRARGVPATRLDVENAFHSAEMDPILEGLHELAKRAGFGAPTVPFYSTLSGYRADGEIAAPAYWARQAREPVRFHDALRALPVADDTVVMELGAKCSLAPLVARAMPELPWLSCGGAPDPETSLLRAVAELFERGADIDWPRLFADGGASRTHAPTYPFEGQVRLLPIAGRAAPLAAVSTSAATPRPPAGRTRERVSNSIDAALQGLAGLAADQVDADANWFSLGLDSLLIVQLQQALNREHRIAIPIAEIFEHGDTPNRLRELILSRLPAEPELIPAAADQKPAASPPPGPLTELFAKQIEAMNALFARQLDALKGVPAGTASPVVSAPAAPAASTADVEVKGLYRKIPDRRADWTPAQQQHVRKLADAYGKRARSSKEHTAKYRDVFANPRSVIGFRPEWKELTYPLHVARADGAHVWDIDDHRYIDITMGFGATLFGHNPPFVRRAIETELAAGAALGPQSTRAGKVARMIAEMTGVERVAFFSTGSEAVMVAVRLARAVTHRNRIAFFTNSYHGTFDGVLAAGWAQPGRVTTLPIADGTPQGMIDDVMVLRYGDPRSLNLLREHAASLAAVLVEPVQSRDPAVQPAAFLRELRALTMAHDVALIFDEVITGFRIHPGGAQRHFGVAADIVTYGKVVGGGLPIGVVAGRSRFLDAVDGGMWNYGDDSIPSARTAFIAGTFNAHPLTMAAAEAVLTHLQEQGPALQQQLNTRTSVFCDRLDRQFSEAGVPIRTAHFASLFRFEYAENTEILNYHLLNNGVFVWEGRNCFLSTAHTDADLDEISAAVAAGLAAMRADGWLAPAAAIEAQTRCAIARGQREIWFLLAARPEASGAYNETVALDLEGPLDELALTGALDRLIARHQALRATAFDGEQCSVMAPSQGSLIVRDIEDRDEAVHALLAEGLATAFDLEAGTLFRAQLLRRRPDRAVLVLTAHHIIVDGWSFGLLMTELAALYNAERRREEVLLAPAISFQRFVAWGAALTGDDPAADAAAMPPLALPGDSLTRAAGVTGSRLHRRDPRLPTGMAVYDAVKGLARSIGVSPVAALLSAFAVLLGRLADQPRFAIGLPVAGHIAAGMPTLVGHASVVVPIAVDLDPIESFAALTRRLHNALLSLQKEARALFRDGADAAPVKALLNVDRGFALDFDGLHTEWVSAPIDRAKADIFLNVLEFNGAALFDLDYDTALIGAATAARWFDSLTAIIAAAATSPDLAVAALPLSFGDTPPAASDQSRRVIGRFGTPAPVGVLGTIEAWTPGGWKTESAIGRLSADGAIERLASTDRLLRLTHGWVDLDLIERTLSAIPGVSAAAAIVEDEGVTAFIAGAAAEPGRLAPLLADLPADHRPRRYVVLPALPRHKDGEPDRDALAALTLPRVAAVRQLAPRTPLEARIAAIWRDVLRLPSLGVTDSFFDLGGHSLKAIAILARIERAFGRAPALRDFLARPTVAALSACLADAASSEPIPRLPEAADYPASSAQARLWMLDQFEPDLTAYNIGFVLRTGRTIDAAVLEAALTRLALRHESLRTALFDVGGEPRQRVQPAAALDYDTLDLRASANAAEAAHQAAAGLTAQPFDLSSAPLWRVRLIILSDESRIAFSIHHVISDVWSIGILARDLMALLAEEEGAPSVALPELSLQYRDYAAWHNARTAARDAAVSAWRDHLLPLCAPLDLPSDRPRPAVKTYRGDQVLAAVTTEAAHALRAMASRIGAGTFAIVTAAADLLLHRLTGRKEFMIGSVVAGRDRAAIEDVVGFFVNSVPLRVEIDPEQSFEMLACGVRDELLKAIELGEVPLDRIVDSVAAPRDPARNPLFDVVLVLDEREEIRDILQGYDFGFMEIDTPTSQFDFTIYVTDSPAEILLKAVYNSDLFDRPRIEKMMRDLVAILAAAAAAPETAVARLALAPVAASPSFHQERLWFVDKFERGELYAEGPTYYNMPAVLAFDRPPDQIRLQAALDRLVARHELLRAGLTTDGERPVIEVAPMANVVLSVLDSGGDALSSAIADSQKMFDLTRPPLLRAALCGGDREPLLCLTAHHAIADPQALAALAAEMAILYADPGAALPEASSFISVVAATERAQAGAHDEHAKFWRAALDGMTPLLLPTDRPRPSIHTYSAGRVAMTLPAELTARLDACAVGHDCVRADLLRGAFQALLHRLSGQADIMIGEPVSGAFPLLFGPASNLVPERLEMLPGDTFAALVIRSRDIHRTALAHAAMPFDLMVLAVKPKNDMSRTALFDVLFHYDDAPEPPAFGTLHARMVDTGLGWGKYDLVLSIRAHADGLDLSLVYNRDLFAQSTAARIAARFHRLLAEATAQPSQPIAALEILLDGERQAALARARDIAEYPRDLTIHGVFERIAAAQPTAVAVISGERTLSYDELNRAANRLAHRLKALGVQSDEPVGICLDRDIGLPIAMLGILKAGGGYVPIDPDYPAARARFMAEDSGMRVIVTDAAHASGMASMVSTVVDLAALDHEAEGNLPPAARPVSLAYVIYTSGSTGQPKGVMIEHRNVIQLLFQQNLPFGFGPADTWALFHSPCFDFSVWETYGALLFGGRLVIVPKHTAQDAPAFLALLSAHQVTVLNQTPTAFYALSDAALGQPELALKLVIFGGEALQPARLADWHRRHPGVRLVNMYGITETTVHVTWKVIGPAEIADGRSAIGNALPSYAIVVVDADLRLQPPGVPGEICVAGHGVSRGYLNRPELTAARFIEHPDLPGQRLYRSGDFGRLDPDGQLIYLGRIDDQTKVRGYRIETGEIESQLLTHPLIRDAAVRADGANGLTAWLVAEPALTLEAVLTHLGDKLPDYMLPSRYKLIGAIPMTGNGKVDSKRLTQLPATPLASPLGSDDPPQSALEQALAEIWRELTGAASVSRSDNFFELGGHSLKASQAVARIRQRLGRQLSLKDFFSAPTLSALAELIDARATLAGDCIGPAPTPSEPDAGYPLSFAQRRLWLLQTTEPDQVHYNMVGAFVLEGRLDADALARAFAALAARHEVLRTRFVLRRGEPRQIVDAAPEGFTLPLEENASAAEAPLIEKVLSAELHHVFDLSKGPLLRARLMRLPEAAAGQDRSLLALNMHHVVADGWSVTVMLRDLQALYVIARAEPGLSAAQLTTRLTPLSIQYKDFAAWQRAGADSPAVAAARRYWLERFEDGGNTLDLPYDRPRPAVPTRRGDIVALTLDARLSSRLRDLALGHEASLFMVLAALVHVQMHLLSGQADVVIGTPVAGRQRLELEPQVGFYLNLLPLRAVHDSGRTFASVLSELRGVVLDALAHQSYPFDRLVEDIAGPRAANRHPLFDVLLILQNNDPLRLDLPDVKARPLRDVSISAKYDLNFMVEDKPSLELLLEYAVDMFDRSSAAAIAQDFVALAAEVANDPRLTVAELADRIGRPAATPMIVAGADRAQLLAEGW
ncbi:amino acid adenylation domain-containing protein [uncultured Bradyrhizobium sp.]|uniref:amino acid adenylation domain-containing protein n=1 Tax=uncultured Bradyrhizobium sp. TaxID=199684 RepID=UPI0035C98D3C